MDDNILDTLGIRRDHIIAIREAYTHTNKRYSSSRAKHLLELFRILEKEDRKRDTLYWDPD